jgi:hypothetical protein
VQSIGGCVNVNDQDDTIKATDPLPTEPLRLTRVVVLENSPLTDTGLAAFDGCKHLTFLGLSGTQVGDEGLAHFKDCTSLMYLYLQCPRVTSKGLAQFRDCPQLLELELSHTQVNDDGLAHIKRFTNLTHLRLIGTKVTAGGVTDLAQVIPQCDIIWDGGIKRPAADPDWRAALWALCTDGGSVYVGGVGENIKSVDALPKEPFKLTQIYLVSPVKDADLAVVAGCKNLTHVSLLGTKITNAGLAHFKECKTVTDLALSGTDVDDGSVAVIKGFTRLTDLVVNSTRITEKGAKELAAALPGCRIQYDGGTIEPTRK